MPSAASGPAARTPRTYAGVPLDARQAARRARLVAAGLQLFGTHGIAGTRIDDICAEAGLTKRYFYESFAALDDLVQAVVDDVVGRLAEVVVPAIAAGGWRKPRPALSAFMDTLLADPRLVRLLVVETHYGALADRRQQLVDLAVDLWLAADPGADKSPEHLATQRLLAHAMAGAAGEVALAWVDGRIDLAPAEITDHLVRIFERITPRTVRSK